MSNKLDHTNDKKFMASAIKLAKLGRFTTTPNPNVGCVIVKNNQIIGKGFHQKAGQAHAEVNALKQAGINAKDATAYVTLEPCNHFGKTPPCTDSLIKAGIKRVVIASTDPNPLVYGSGIDKLKKQGVRVDVGILTQEANYINRGFFKRMQTGLPYVQLKMGASLDGKIAMASGESKWITSSEARQDVQKFRAMACAILSTRTTVQRDNANLNVRHHELSDEIKSYYPLELLRNPIRIIIDSKNKITGQEALFKTQGDIWLVGKKTHHIKNLNKFKAIIDPSKHNEIDLKSLLTKLGDEQINTLMVETGSALSGSLLEQNLVDELIVYYAPKILGANAMSMFNMPNLNLLNDSPSFNLHSAVKIGHDLRCIFHKNN